MCVGPVHELDHVGDRVTPVVLTPSLVPPPAPSVGAAPVMTIGSLDDIAALTGWRGRVIVKLQSSMRRYGATVDELPAVEFGARTAGLDVIGFALHLPLAGTEADRRAEVGAWLEHVDARQPLWLSHLQPHTYGAVRAQHPDRQFHLRLGTALWHGDKSFLHLHADVAAVHPVRAGDRAGYQLVEVADDGHIVLASAGSAHGVGELPGGVSPFHFARKRLSLLEPPHMHTSMLVAPIGSACPAVGDRVDVQRPLISTLVDEVEWV